MNEPLLLKVSDVSARLKLGRSLVYQLLARGEIRSIKVSGARRVPAAALADFVRQKEEEATLDDR